MEAPDYQRLRIIFGKAGPARWTGHLDVARTWERALNRAKIPMAYTQGFNRRPRMQFASALPLGYTSRSEIVDLWLREPMEPDTVMAQLKAKMAPGITIHTCHEVPRRQKSLPVLTREALYDVQLTFVEQIDEPTLTQRISDLLARDTVEWEKAGRKNKGKMYNMRPQILALAVVSGEPLGMHMRLTSVEGNTGRPGHVLAALGLDPLDAKVERTELILSEDAAVLS